MALKITDVQDELAYIGSEDGQHRAGFQDENGQWHYDVGAGPAPTLTTLNDPEYRASIPARNAGAGASLMGMADQANELQDILGLGMQEPPEFRPYSPGTGLFTGGFAEPQRFQMDAWGNIVPTSDARNVPLNKPEMPPQALGPTGLGLGPYSRGGSVMQDNSPQGAGQSLFGQGELDTFLSQFGDR